MEALVAVAGEAKRAVDHARAAATAGRGHARIKDRLAPAAHEAAHTVADEAVDAVTAAAAVEARTACALVDVGFAVDAHKAGHACAGGRAKPIHAGGAVVARAPHAVIRIDLAARAVET